MSNRESPLNGPESGWSSFEGKVALVTGAGSGIGRETSLQLARRGARVVLSDVSEDHLEAVRDEISAQGGEALSVRADVASEADVRSLVDAAVKQWSKLDMAFNNAGIGGAAAPTGEYTVEQWTRVISVNLTGVWLCMRYEIPALLETGGGSIVNMASILGTVGYRQAPAYVAAKHGVVGLTKAAAAEYATQGLRVNAICPGFIATPLLEAAGLLDEDSEVAAYIRGLHPMNRLGTSLEVADAVCWLLSDEASFVTGASLLVDGGYTAV